MNNVPNYFGVNREGTSQDIFSHIPSSSDRDSRQQSAAAASCRIESSHSNVYPGCKAHSFVQTKIDLTSGMTLLVTFRSSPQFGNFQS